MSTPALDPMPRELDVDSLEAFDARSAAALGRRRHPGRIAGWHVQSVDLTGRAAVLKRLDVSGAVFLGCELAPGLEDSLRARGALVFLEHVEAAAHRHPVVLDPRADAQAAAVTDIRVHKGCVWLRLSAEDLPKAGIVQAGGVVLVFMCIDYSIQMNYPFPEHLLSKIRTGIYDQTFIPDFKMYRRAQSFIPKVQ